MKNTVPVDYNELQIGTYIGLTLRTIEWVQCSYLIEWRRRAFVLTSPRKKSEVCLAFAEWDKLWIGCYNKWNLVTSEELSSWKVFIKGSYVPTLKLSTFNFRRSTLCTLSSQLTSDNYLLVLWIWIKFDHLVPIYRSSSNLTFFYDTTISSTFVGRLLLLVLSSVFECVCDDDDQAASHDDDGWLLYFGLLVWY